MSTTHLLRVSLTTLLFLAMPALHAEKITVKPGGTYSTIQAGIDVSSAGDTIEIRTGTYQENLQVNLNSVTLKAKGEVVLDALPSGGVSTGLAAIEINGSNVTIKGFTIINSRDEYAIQAGGEDLTLKQMTFIGCDGGITITDNERLTVDDCLFIGNSYYAVYCETPNSIIKNCTIRSQGGDGSIYVGSNNVTVKKNTIVTSAEAAILSYGQDVTIENNDIRNCGSGIHADVSGGGTFSITDNTISCTENDAISVEGNDGSAEGLIKKNTISHCYQEGIEVYESLSVRVVKNSIDNAYNGIRIEDSDSVIVDQNRVERADQIGIYCQADSPTITDNTISRAAHGVWLDAAVVDGGIVSGNTVTHIIGDGIQSNTTGISDLTVEDNEVSYCGSIKGAGIVINGGSSFTIRNNTCKNNGGDGFRFELGSDGHVISNNTATDNGVDGMDIESSSCTVSDNTCKNNGAEGIEVNGDSNVIDNNKSRNNRIDMTNDGTSNIFSGNTYDTGDDSTSPEID